MTKIVALATDMGCIGNVIPGVDELLGRGLEVSVLCTPGSIAEERITEGYDFIDDIPPDALVLTCLPNGAGFDQVKQQRNTVILLAENPDPDDIRFHQWLDANLRSVCMLVRNGIFGRTVVTGMPAVDLAVEEILNLDPVEICNGIGIDPEIPTVSLALPGDEADCVRMIEAIGETDAIVIARSHPKLERDDPEGYARVSKLVDSLRGPSLEEANTTLDAYESIALAIGISRHFVTTHNSTMAWQAAAAGVHNVQVLPPENAPRWTVTAPIITSTYGRVLENGLQLHTPKSTLTTGDAVKRIADVVEAAL